MSKTKRIIAAVTAAIITATSYAAISVSAEDNGGSDHGFVSSSVSAQTDKNEAAVSNAQLYDKLGQLLKQGDSLKYGEALYTTGTPDGEKWTKDFYEQRVDFYGEEFLAKYIVNGEFLRDKVVSDMAEITTKENNSGLKATAEDINEYMRSNGISGFTYVREVDGVERIFISYDGFFEKIKAYVVDTGVDESFIVYQQSEDYAIVSDKSENDKSAEESCLKAYAKDISDFMLRSGIAGDAFVRDDKVVVTYSAYEDKIKTYIREKGLDESVIVYEAGKNVADTSEEDKKSTLKETAESINEYMRSNGISGFTYVRAVDGVEKIFISYDGFFEKIKAYVVDTGVDENLVVYQQSQDYEAVTQASYKIVSLPDKLEYKLGEQIDLTGIQIEMSKGEGKAVVYTYPDVAFDYQSNIPKSPSVVLSTDFRSDIAGTYAVKVTDSENASFTVKVVDITASSDTSENESSLKEDAESINEYMRSNGISGFTYVRAIDGVEKIFVSYDGFLEEIQAYVKEKGIDENFIVYQQSYDYTSNESTLKGDANCDGQVDLSDAVMIMQALANPNKYGLNGTAEHHLTEQGKLNGDMNGDGLTVGDAQSIQRKLLGLDENDSNQNIDNSEYLFGNEPSGSVMTPQRLALNCNSFCANGETLNVKMLMGDKYTYNQEHNSYPNYDSEGYPEYSIFATENFNKIDDERLIINGKKSEFTKTFSNDDMKSLDISQKEGDYSSYYNDTAEIDFSNYTSGSTGCISFRFGWKADGENPLNPTSDFAGTSQTMYFYVGEDGTGISINGIEAAQKAYDEKSDNDIMFYDSLYLKWNDKEVMSNLYEKLRKPNDEVLPIIFKLSSSPNGNFEYKGKTLEEYGKERLSQNYLKYEQLLIYGDYLKYGEDIYKTGAPDGTKWVKEFYEETIDDIGEELISKYIVGGEFLKDKLEADIAELKKKANDAYNEAEKAYLKSISDKAIKQLDEQNIKYEYKTDPKRLVIYATAEEFKSLNIDNVLRYWLDITAMNR